VNEKNTWQDIMGQFTVCEKCESSYNIEPMEPIDPQDRLNALTTKADELYTSLDEGQVLCEVETKVFLNQLVDYLESIGGKVEGIEYTKEDKQ
jgi:hypothetical protein